MIGETIMGHKRMPHAWLLWILPSALMVAGNVAANGNHFLILSLAPFAVGFAVLMTRREPLIFRFEDEGIEVLSPEFGFISYRSIEAITVGDEDGRQASLGVLHRHGALNIPTDIDEESRRVYRFLRAEMPREVSFGPPPSLRPFMEEQDEQFSERRVFAYRALGVPRIAKGLTFPFAFCALIVVGSIWVIIGAASDNHSEWIGIGVLAILCSMGGFVISMQQRRPSGPDSGDGGVVIGPAGIAVEQGELLGRMRWDEITEISRNPMSYAVEVHFHGGKLTLPNIYHRSLRTIYRRLLDYWEGPLHDRY